MPTPLVSVCIVTWNSAADLPACLESLSRQDYPNLEVIVVDNASRDDSAQLAARLCPQAHILTHPSNQGFCGGHNAGIAAAQGDFYLPLNPDVILEPSYISATVEALAANPQAGMAATRLYLGAPGEQQPRFDSTGLFIDRKRRQFLRGFNQPDDGRFRAPEAVFGVDGAAPLYRRAMLEDIKIEGEVFDEAFFAHKEDVDLCWRARIFGWTCVYAPQAVAHHRRNFKPGKRAHIAGEVKLHAVKNRYLLLIKNESSAGWRRDGLRILFYDLKILAYLLLFERSSLKALALVRQHWARALRWRAEIRRRARVSPREQAGWFKD